MYRQLALLAALLLCGCGSVSGAVSGRATVDTPAEPASLTLMAIRATTSAAFGTANVYRPFGQYSDLAWALTGAPASAVNERGFVILEGVLHNGANAGNVNFQWAQNTSDAGSTSVLSGSWLEYKVVQ